MITVPNIRPTGLRSIEVDFGTTISRAIWRRVRDAIVWYDRALPLGTIQFFYSSQQFASGGQIPGPSSQWHFMDGSPVTNSASPLFGLGVDLRGRFLKHGSSLGAYGGIATHDLTHNHGGSTGVTSDLEGQNLTDDDNEKPKGGPHSHSIGTSGIVISVLPPYIELQPYMRVDGGITASPNPALAKIDNEITKFGKIYSKELAEQVKNWMDFLGKTIPGGPIYFIMTHLPGVPAPDPNILQECNGSEITNSNSPFRSLPGQQRFTPNLIDRYLRITKTLGLVGGYGGTNSTSFQHGHGGQTGTHDSPEGADSSKGPEQNTSFSHSHSISGDLFGTRSLEPLFYIVKPYMRIQ